MTVQEAYDKLFTQPMVEYMKNTPQEVIDFLQTQTGKLCITESTIEIDDLKRKLKEPEYLNDQRVVINDTSMQLQALNKEILQILIKYINKDLTELELPSSSMEDLSFLTNFPNLTTLTIKGYCIFSEEEISFIKEKTNITRINTSNGTITNSTRIPEDNELELTQPQRIFISGKLINVCTRKPYSYTTINAKIKGSNINLDLLEQACSEIYNPEHKPISTLEIDSALLEQKYGISDKCLLKLKFNEQNEIEELFYNGSEDISKLREIVSKIEQKTKIHKIVLKCENKTYENSYYLNSIARKYPLEINYGDLKKCSLEEFHAMRETLDYFNELIRENNLSPLEILMYAYDIMKTFRYKENPDDKDQSRYMHNIVMTDYIVCVGYAKFMEQILRENNMLALETSVTCDLGNDEYGGHARDVVVIDDDKYDVHGIYAIDATWDSAKGRPILVADKDGKQHVVKKSSETDTIEKTYDANALYRNFLIPVSEYTTVFPNDTIPASLQVHLDNNYDILYTRDDTESPTFMARIQVEDLFGKLIPKDDLKDYLSARKPSLDVFRRVLYNVRLAEGYTSEEALDSLVETVELNTMIDELNREVPTFFRDQASKK